jgi:GAF domain-containing protein
MNRPDGRPFDVSDVQLLEARATQAAIVIENARLYAQVEQAARTSQTDLEGLSAEMETWQRAAEANLTQAAVVYLLESPLLLMNEAGRLLFENLGTLGEVVLGELREILEDIRMVAPVATRTSATHVLPASEGAEPILMAHIALLLDQEGHKHALVAHLVDIRG